jgi:hypothetical protein
MKSPNVSRQWDRPIETIGPMKHHRLNKLSPTERTELNGQLKDVAEASMIPPSRSQFGSPIFCV